MHALGNDFIIINEFPLTNYNIHELAAKLCNRYTGIGADGLIWALPSKKADLRMRFFNSNGSEAPMCGNGIRCLTRFALENGMADIKNVSIETLAGIIRPEVLSVTKDSFLIRVNMGSPKLEREEIPMTGNNSLAINDKITVNGKVYHMTCMVMTVPHAVIFVDDLDTVDLVKEGREIEEAPIFPDGINVNFAQIINDKEIKIQSWERGAGVTLACGTGSCAAVVTAVLNRWTNNKVLVHQSLGALNIEWIKNTVFMTGPAEVVFKSKVELSKFSGLALQTCS